MEKNNIEIVPADFNNAEHKKAIPFLLNEYAKNLLGLQKEIDRRVLAELVPGLEKFPGALVLLAKTAKHYVGMAICFVGFSTFKAQPLINIHDFLVVGEYRNQGIGQAILRKIEAIAKEMGCCKVTLEVQENNTGARRLYRLFGFSDSFLEDEAGGHLSLTKTL